MENLERVCVLDDVDLMVFGHRPGSYAELGLFLEARAWTSSEAPVRLLERAVF